MKKIFLILVAIIFTTSVNAHSTKNLNFDLKKEKCLKRGVTIGGDHMDEYMPQFINFFKENLL